MAAVTHSKKAGNKSLISMAAMDFNISMLVYKRMVAIGMSHEELSFLMGKRNQYILNLLDPTQKNKFKTEQLDILPSILNCSIRDIVPNNIALKGDLLIKGSKKVLAKKIEFNFEVASKDGKAPTAVTMVFKITKGGRKLMNMAVYNFILSLVTSGYFNEPKEAFVLYLHVKQQLPVAFTPTDVQKCLATLLRNDGKPALLTKSSVNSRYVYEINIPI